MKDVLDRQTEYINPAKVFGDQLPKLNRVLRKEVNRILYKYKLSYLEWSIILSSSKRTTLEEISNTLGISDNLSSRYVIRLERLGILSSDFDYSDDKFKVIFINPNYVSVFEKISQDIDSYFDQFLKVLSYSELTSFCEILMKLNGEYLNYVNSILGIPQSVVSNQILE